ncbi:MAG: hypothetical protein V7641_1580 [Blastocatellia bacterium]
MRKYFLMAVLLLIGESSALAQECCPSKEIFLGYSYFNASATGDRISSNQFTSRYGLNGTGASFAWNRSPKLGFIGNFSYNARKSTIGEAVIGGVTIGEAKSKLRNYTLLFGPQFSARSSDTNYFLHVMAGMIIKQAELSGAINPDNPAMTVNLKSTSTNLALGIGGGFDMHVARHLSLRLFQLDYIPSRVEKDTLDGKAWNHNFRLQAGILISWGLAK